MPEPDTLLQNACRAYVQAILAARESASNEEDYWKDNASNKAYQDLVRAALKGKEHVRAGYALLFLLGDFSSSVFHDGLADPGKTSKSLCRQIVALISRLSSVAWLGFTPLEGRFSAFPEYTDLGGASILNLRSADPAKPRKLLDRFSRVLSKRFGLLPEANVTAANNYYDLGVDSQHVVH